MPNFLAIDYLNLEMSEQRYRFAGFQIPQLRNLIRLLVYAKDETHFDKHTAAIDQITRWESFDDNFHKNCLACKDLWATYLRGSIPHLDDNMNNRPRTKMGPAKWCDRPAHWNFAFPPVVGSRLVPGKDQQSRLPGKSALRHGDAANLRATYSSQSTTSASVSVRCKVNTKVRSECTATSSSACLPKPFMRYATLQLTLAITVATHTNDATLPLQIDLDVSTCQMNQTMLLPCRHVLYLRQALPFGRTIIPLDDIPASWRLGPPWVGEIWNDTITQPHRSFQLSEIVIPPAAPVMDGHEKYRVARQVSQAMAEWLPGVGTVMLKEWTAHLRDIDDMIRHRQRPRPVRVVFSSTSSEVAGQDKIANADASSTKLNKPEVP